jgi:predicted thioesterase
VDPKVEAGVEGRLERVVDESLLTRHVGGEGVFATPSMILLMENAAHFSVAPLIGDGQTTVGYEVCVKHLGMSEPGATVVATSLLREVNGNKLLFDVQCHDGDRLVGTGTHKRAVVPTRR